MVGLSSLFVRRAAALWAGPLATALAYYAAATLSLLLTTSTHGIAVVWPSSGVLLAALLLAPRPAWACYVAAAGLASLLANLGAGNSLAVSAGFTAANMAESVLAAWLLRRQGCRPSFLDLAGVGRFCTAGIAGAALGAMLATLTAAALLPAALAPFWLSWLTTDLLGILVVAPMILIAAELPWRAWRSLGGRQAAQAAGLLGAVALTTAGAFAQSTYPLLFLPLLPLLAAVVSLGPGSAVAGVWIIAAVGLAATALGIGPIHLIDGSQAARVLFLQAYLLATFAAALPVAALLAARDALAATRDRLTVQLLERNRLLGMAEAAARVGHWRLDAATQSIFWSPEVFRICGRAGAEPPSLGEAIEAYHPDDQPMVAAAVQAALEHGAPFDLTACLMWPCGEVRHVLARGEVDRDGAGRIVGVFGVFQDVSRQVAHEAALTQAREAAEEAARLATALAETDPLTGLPNRRRTMDTLAEAIADARMTGEPLSVAMLDVDRFKRINDTFGHAVGDEVLRRVAREAMDALRAGDFVGRIGGEEFVLVLGRADAASAAAVAERVRLAIRAGGDLGGDAPTDPPVTASFGVATLADAETADQLLRRADRALYAAKRAGRNTLRHAARDTG